MGPIDYTLQVLDPIQAALQQRGLRFAEEQQVRAGDQQDVALGQGQQRIDLARQQMMMQQAEAERQRQEQAAAQARAEAGQKAFVDFMFAPNKTAEQARAVIEANPEMGQAVMEYWQGQNEAQQASELAFAKQFAFALNKSPEAAKSMLESRADAAEQAGDQAKAATYRSQAEMLKMGGDGAEAVKAQTLAIMAGVMEPKDLQTFMEAAGYAGEEEAPLSTVGKLEADFRAGRISEEAYKAELANRAPQGMTIESDGQGGFRMVQGAGVSGASKPFTEGQSKDIVYATRAKGALDAFEPVAEALTSRLDRAAEMDPTGLSRGAQSDNFQVALNAGNEFLQAILRKDTGAAITEQEQALYGETYLPRPGDNAALLAQKSEARKRAVAAIEAGMSPAQMIAQEKALQKDGAGGPSRIRSWADAMALGDAQFTRAVDALAARGIAVPPDVQARYDRVKGGGQ